MNSESSNRMKIHNRICRNIKQGNSSAIVQEQIIKSSKIMSKKVAQTTIMRRNSTKYRIGGSKDKDREDSSWTEWSTNSSQCPIPITKTHRKTQKLKKNTTKGPKYKFINWKNPQSNPKKTSLVHIISRINNNKTT